MNTRSRSKYKFTHKYLI